MKNALCTPAGLAAGEAAETILQTDPGLAGCSSIQSTTLTSEAEATDWPWDRDQPRLHSPGPRTCICPNLPRNCMEPGSIWWHFLHKNTILVQNECSGCYLTHIQLFILQFKLEQIEDCVKMFEMLYILSWVILLYNWIIDHDDSIWTSHRWLKWSWTWTIYSARMSNMRNYIGLLSLSVQKCFILEMSVHICRAKIYHKSHCHN